MSRGRVQVPPLVAGWDLAPLVEEFVPQFPSQPKKSIYKVFAIRNFFRGF
jgi:hypothetical protein